MIVRNALIFAAGVGILAGLAAVPGCTPKQEAAVTKGAAVARLYQAKLAGACQVAMTLAPIAGPVAPWIVGGCATEAAIAKLALDPSSLAWLQGLVAKAKA